MTSDKKHDIFAISIYQFNYRTMKEKLKILIIWWSYFSYHIKISN